MGIKTIWVLAHKEFLVTKYVKRKALKHTKVFFVFLSISKITLESILSNIKSQISNIKYHLPFLVHGDGHVVAGLDLAGDDHLRDRMTQLLADDT